jgi:hypothetical protein
MLFAIDDRFTEGGDTADLRSAQASIEALDAAS